MYDEQKVRCGTAPQPDIADFMRKLNVSGLFDLASDTPSAEPPATASATATSRASANKPAEPATAPAATEETRKEEQEQEGLTASSPPPQKDPGVSAQIRAQL
jgi:hypothetical protein